MTADGREHAVYVIVLATGFKLGLANAPFPVTGVGGLTLDQAWKDGAVAYTNRAMSPNDACISLGQVYVVRADVWKTPSTEQGKSSMKALIQELNDLAAKVGRPIKLMEVCGCGRPTLAERAAKLSHSKAFGRCDIRIVKPPGVRPAKELSTFRSKNVPSTSRICRGSSIPAT